MNLLFAALATFVLNMPFGYIRHGFKKFSFLWFLAIHLPIPFVVLFRYLFGLGFQLYTYPVMVIAFFSGQYFGKRIRIYYEAKKQKN
ncbi:hypothetical protein DLK05_03530 [Ancylomarina longa]|uniref:Uncharacterized protein n=1 Tax=Ancylomarina longa TaxID=2487017 RepID=A0A434AY90_9BACT|nr:hypothetical protein DLK05_03530 [Ancylomarina longa]